MSNFIFLILMVIGGAALAIQPTLNARLAEKTGFLQAATISFAVGTLACLVCVSFP
jgi:transporter family-2 protein